MPFVIEIKPQIITNIVTAAYPPIFMPPPQQNFTIFIGEPWQYTLPQYVDPQNADVTVKVEMGGAILFT